MTFPVAVASRVSKPAGLRKARRSRPSCSTFALATVLVVGASPAAAQSFQGTGTFTNPAHGSISTGTNTTDITINAPQAVIDWAPFDTSVGSFGAIGFQYSGTTATFTGSSDFAVLNRINPADTTRIIAMGGTINSFVGPAVGGRVYFYSPSGFVLTGTSVINVGSLVMSALPISVDGSGNFINNGTVVFGQAPNPAAKIVTVSDVSGTAQITATQAGSYIALVAPRVEHGGTVNVNGTAAYVAAEAATMTVNQGLFNISVDIGTTDAQGIVHSGTTGGPSSTGAGDNHRIYMVAVPKNQALEMLLSGNIGFAPATEASIQNGTIVLSAGYNTLDTGGFVSLSTFGEPGDASFSLGNGSVSSNLEGYATTDAWAHADDGTLAFSGNVKLQGRTSAILAADNAGTLTVGGDATLNSWNGNAGGEAVIYANNGATVDIAGNAFVNAAGFSFDGIGGDGGTAGIGADGGSVTVGGDTTIYTAVAGGMPVGESSSAGGFGGESWLNAANGGTLTLENVSLYAFGQGQDNQGIGGTAAGSGFGGYITIQAQSGGSINVSGDVFATADGYGGAMEDGSTGGGGGFGGSIYMAASGDTSSIDISGNYFATALGVGGSWAGESLAPAVAIGGFGQGGFAGIGASGGSTSISGFTTLRADGTGGHAQVGGGGRGGTAGVGGVAGSVSLGANTNVSAVGTGGNAVVGFGGAGGDGLGGDAYIRAAANIVEGPFTAATIIGDNVLIDASGHGGDGGDGNGDNIAAGAGGTGRGGSRANPIAEQFGGAFAEANAAGASLQLGNVSVLAIGTGGEGGDGVSGQAGGAGGAAFGGVAQAGAYNDGGELTGDAGYGVLNVDASAWGGSGGSGSFGAANGVGGNASGGAGCNQFCDGALFHATGTTTAASINLAANAFGGIGSTGGSGTGGLAYIFANGPGTLTVAASTNLSADGSGGDGEVGGNGFGGDASISGFNGTLNFGPSIGLSAGGRGGDAILGFGGAGGEGIGGSAGIEALTNAGDLQAPVLTAATITGGTAVLNVVGEGGDGGAGFSDGVEIFISAGSGGIGRGGLFNGQQGSGGAFAASQNPGASLTLGYTNLVADGMGGTGGTGGLGQAGGAGGAAYGGSAQAGNYDTYQTGANSATATYGFLRIQAAAHGGDGGVGPEGQGDGGAAYGGVTYINAKGTVNIAGGVEDFVLAIGGEGANGGDAEGGFAYVRSFAGSTLSVSDDVEIHIYGQGGNATTGTGGDGFGGNVDDLPIGVIAYEDASITVGGLLHILADGWGGDGAAGGFGQGGDAYAAAQGGSISTGSLTMNANGEGGAGAVGGDGQGGVSTLNLDGGSLTAGSLAVRANGTGGNGGELAGEGRGGVSRVDILAGGGTVTTTGLSIIAAHGFGGIGTDDVSTVGGTGGLGRGGTAAFDVASPLNIGASATISTGGLELRATGLGGAGGNGTFGGAGGEGRGGTAQFMLRGVNMNSTGLVSASSFASGGAGGIGSAGAGGNGGAAFGGTSLFSMSGTFTALNYVNTSSTAAGAGGAGSTVAGNGGNAQGGTGTAIIDGNLTTTSTDPNQGFLVTAFGGGGGLDVIPTNPADFSANGGNAQGGTVNVTINGSYTGAYIQATASAGGGRGRAGAGGNATGGTATLSIPGTVNGARINVATFTTGGAGTTAGGAAISGTATLDISGTVDASTTNVSATATGGAASAGSGGNATGGAATVALIDGSLTSGPLTVSTEAIGGNGSVNGGNAAQRATNGGASLTIDVTSSGSLTGTTTIFARSTGGNGTTGTGGTGTGANASLIATGGNLSTTGLMHLDAGGKGGSGTVGGTGASANARVSAQSGGKLTLGSLSIRAEGTGGASSAGAGANGTGGIAEMLADGAGSEIRVLGFTPGLSGYINPSAMISSNGAGGASSGGNGGTGTGGDSNMLATAGANIVLATPTGSQRNDVVARGFGGAATLAGSTAGTAVGGDIMIGADNATITLPAMLASSFAQAGNYGNPINNVSGGNAIGGSRSVYARNGATMSIGLTGGGAGAGGGYASGSGNGGNATGGTVSLDVNAATVNLLANMGVIAGGEGGSGAQGGNASGGTAIVNVVNGGIVQSSLAGANLSVGAPSIGGVGTGNGGSATAANVTVTVDATSRISLAGGLSVGAGAVGGNGGSGNGGSATGTSATVNIQGDVDVASLSANLDVTGGSSTGGGDGGLGNAGDLALNITGPGASLIAGTLAASANSFGGDGVLGGFAGSGSAVVTVNDGSLTLTVPSSIYANSSGGEATTGGTGGGAQGGTARLSILNGGTASIASLELGADAFGGGILGAATGTTGGAADAGLARIEVDASSLTVTGELFLSAEGEGGDGDVGAGNGLGGNAELFASNGATVQLGTSTNIEAEGTGGSALNGNGGDGYGGDATLGVYGASTLSANDLGINASADGGDGLNGGFGYGGTNNEGGGGAQVEVFGTGSALTLTGATELAANGEGGDGQIGGSSGAGIGGNAGFRILGGSASFDTLAIRARGLAASGGSTTNPSIGGTVTLSASGGTISGNDIGLFADSDGTGGQIDVVAGANAQNLTAIDVNSLGAYANGIGSGGDLFLQVGGDADVNLGVLALYAEGVGGTVSLELGQSGFANQGPILFADSVDIRSGDAIDLLSHNGAGIDVIGAFAAQAQGAITFTDFSGGAVLAAPTIDLVGSDIQIGWAFDAADVALSVYGDYIVSSLPSATNNLSVSAGGNLSALQALVSDSNLAMIAGGNMSLAGITVTGSLDLTANGNLAAGNVTAGGYADLEALGDIAFGNVSATELDFNAGGAVTGGNIVVAIRAGGEADGAIALGDITVGPEIPVDDFSVGMTSGTSISVGDVSGPGKIGFATLGDLTAGDLNGGELVMTLVGGDTNVGAITTDADGHVYMADASMFALGGGGTEAEFDETVVLGMDPIRTGGAIVINGPVSAGRVHAAAGTNLTAGAIHAVTDIYLDAGGVLTTGNLSAGTAITGASDGNLDVGAAAAGESISLSSGGNLDAVSLDAPSVALALAGDFVIGELFADNSLAISAGGNLTAGNLFVGGDLSLTAGLDLVALDLTASGDIALDAGGSITAGDLSAGVGIVVGAGGSVTLGMLESGVPPIILQEFTTQAIVPTPNDISLSSGGDLVTESITSRGNILLDALGAVTTGDLDALAGIEGAAGTDLLTGNILAGQDVTLTAAGALTALDVAGSAVALEAGSDLTVGGVTADTTADFIAGGLASFLGTVAAQQISVTSAQIFIADEGGLGEQGLTELITLNAVSDDLAILIGGEEPGEEGQWHLTGDGDISADAVVINAIASTEGGSAPDIVIRAVEIEGSNSDGGGVQTVTVNTGGSVFVDGPVAFRNAAATDTLSINAGDSIQVDTDGGSIAMTNGDDVSGILELTAHDIWVAEGDVLAQLNADLDFPGRDEALAVNNGPVNEAGAIQAGELTVTMLGSSFVVQNTGTSEEPAGLTVGDGGLTVVNEGTEPATVIIYGRQANSDGTVTGGDDFAEEVEFAGNEDFADGSNVNGCDVGGGCGPEQPPVDGGGVEVILGPIGLMEGPSALVSTEAEFGDPSSTDDGTQDESSDEEAEEEEEESEDSKAKVNAGTGLINSGPVTLDVPIEQPVTSGNDGPGL